MSNLLHEHMELNENDVETRFGEIVASIEKAYDSLSPEEKTVLELTPQRKPSGSDDQGRQDEND